MTNKDFDDIVKTNKIDPDKSLVQIAIEEVEQETSTPIKSKGISNKRNSEKEKQNLKSIFKQLGYKRVGDKITHSNKEALDFLSARFLEEDIEHSKDIDGLSISDKGISKLCSKEEDIVFKLQNKSKEVSIIAEEQISSNLRAEVLSKILLKKTNEASELIVQHIIKNNHIVTMNAENHKDLANREMFIYRDGIYIRKAINVIEAVCREILGDSFKTSFMALVVSKIQADTCIDREEFMKRDKNLIPCKNGVLNIENNSLLEYSPEMNFRHKYNANYDINSNRDLVKESFFNLFSNDEEGQKDLLTLQEVIGCCFHHGMPVHNFAILFGAGRNSKGTILRIIKDIIEEDACEIGLNKLVDKDQNQNFFLANFYGKSANLAGDLDGMVFKFSGLLKNLTGGDKITCPIKGNQEGVKFTSVAQNIFSTNELPIFTDKSIGFWERVNLIKFQKITFISQIDYDSLKESGEDMSQYGIKKDESIFHSRDFLDAFFMWGLEGLFRIIKIEFLV